MINIRLVNQGETVMSKGSGRRKQDISEEELEEAWNRIFKGNVVREEDKKDGNKPNTKDSEEATG
jgi:cytoskeletal protein CcmA (bactofilin family)